MRFTKGEVNRAGKLLLELGKRMDGEGEGSAVEALGGEAELDRAWEALTWWRSLHARPLSTVAANLRYHVDKEGGRVEGRIEVTQRLKRHVTLIDKLAREKGNVTQMHDIGGVRARLPSFGHVYALSRRLRKTWTIIKVRDYIAEPKDTGYRALHLIVKRNGFPIEVQLRTEVQDIWANMVEDITRKTGSGLKFGTAEADDHAKFAAVADVLASLDRGEITIAKLRELIASVRS
jgi:putative GTP pyrophosphokinase